VERVFLPKPCRGFAYVSLNDPKVVKRLCQIRDFVCAGKSIYVSIPRPKKQESEPVKKDYRTGLPRGYGFIKMKTLEDQEKVLKEGDFYIDGRMAQVKYPDHGQDGGDQDDRITTKIYVGRVYAEITETDLHKLFDEEAKKISPLAKVERVFLPKPCRGFAYVSLNDPKVVKRLCQIRDFVCAGKSIYVSIPRPKKQESEP
ncbi:hypothetical protein WUBG_16494, partial [Wuchereria bancrofti]